MLSYAGVISRFISVKRDIFRGKGLLQRFFFRTGYVYAEETERAEELQEYVTQNKLSASDYKMLKNGVQNEILMTSRFQGENGCCLIFPTTVKLCMAAEKYQI